MKVLVSIKRVVDYNVKIRLKSDGTDVDIDNVKMSINPFDEIALEEAIRLKEKGVATEVVVASIGPEAVQETIRHALALGADRGLYIDAPSSPEPLTVAKILKVIAHQEQADILLLGKQAIDDDCNQVAQMVSALLDWPQSTFVSHLAIENGRCQTLREVDGGLESLSLPLPAVISADLRLNTPRYATLPNIMKAKQKPIQRLSLSDLGIDGTPHTKILGVAEPSKRKGGVTLQSVDELIPIIAKVI